MGADGAAAVLRLAPHPDSTALAAGLAVEVAWSLERGSVLRLKYAVAGRWPQLRIAAAEAPRRVDGLWQHTCFEAFIGDAGGAGYCEFNSAPSGAWAAYRFAGYRTTPEALASPTQLPIATATVNGRFVLDTSVELGWLPAEFRRPLRLALAAVLEDGAGTLSYWALAHAPGRPDFHDQCNFLLTIPG